MAKKQTESVQAEVQPQQTEQAPNLTLQDLVLVAQVIQLTSQRGAFRAEELQTVGALYDKLIAFLDSVGAITKPENANTENQNA
jgi:hypothetical protein